MTNATNKTTTNPVLSNGPTVTVREALTIADGASAKVDNAGKAFTIALGTLISLDITVACLSGKKGDVLEGIHYATAKDAIAKRVLTKAHYIEYTNTTLALKVGGKDTLRGAIAKRVNSRLANLRNALARELAVKVKGGAGAAKLNAQEAGLKVALDKAAMVKKSFGDQKTEAAQAAKAAWVDVNAVHAAWVTLHDTLIAIHGKHGGGK